MLTNFKEWRLVKSAGDKDFSWTLPFQLIFPEMTLRDKASRAANKKNWMQRESKVVDVIYTILRKELQKSKKREEAAAKKVFVCFILSKVC